MRTFVKQKTAQEAVSTAQLFLQRFFPDALDALVFGSAARSNSSPNDIDIMIVLPDGRAPVQDKDQQSCDIFYKHWSRPHTELPLNLIKTDPISFAQQEEFIEWKRWRIDLLAITPERLTKYIQEFDPRLHMPVTIWAIGQPTVEIVGIGNGILKEKLIPLLIHGISALNEPDFVSQLAELKHTISGAQEKLRNSDNYWSDRYTLNMELCEQMRQFMHDVLGLWRLDSKRIRDFVTPEIAPYFFWQEAVTSAKAYCDGADATPNDYDRTLNHYLPVIQSIREGSISLYLHENRSGSIEQNPLTTESF